MIRTRASGLSLGLSSLHQLDKPKYQEVPRPLPARGARKGRGGVANLWRARFREAVFWPQGETPAALRTQAFTC